MCPFCQGGTTASQLLKEGCRSPGCGWSVKKKKMGEEVKLVHKVRKDGDDDVAA